MSLTVGSRLGHYDVTALIGEGGMGQVYQATDTKLNRQVALKILPEAFATDPDRLARFQREAQVLASLNHPNIAQIHGLEETDDTRALVLELVEGPTLADRIAQGPIPVDEALPIAKQIAEALEAAHEQGVIHRDLKPANIKIRPDGTVKVLDFGLAKALDTAPEGDPSQSPTLTAAATQMGVIMGTAAYMSPEQARGKPTDRRADIWSFGVVLFEMLTGQRAFAGEDVSVTLADVIRADLSWDTLPSDLPPGLATYLRRCLEKEPGQRIQAIGDVRLAMEGAFETPPIEASAPEVMSGRLWHQPVSLAILGLSVAVVAGVMGWAFRGQEVIPADPMRFAIVPPESSPLLQVRLASTDLAISPDGTQVVYRGGSSEDRSQLIRRSIGQFAGTPIRGALGTNPFFSPDGLWVGFTGGNGRTLQKAPILGGPPVTVVDAGLQMEKGTWGTDDRIIVGRVLGGLLAVSAAGGVPEVLTTPERSRGELAHMSPSIIPGRDAVLFVIAGVVPLVTGQLAVLDLASRAVTRLGVAGIGPKYVPTGHLVYADRYGTLNAAPFDDTTLAITGNSIPIVEDVHVKAGGPANFALSNNGHLVYAEATGPKVDLQHSLVWVDLAGQEELTPAPAETYLYVSLSPDSARAAVEFLSDSGDVDVGVVDLSRGTFVRITTDPGDDSAPLWSPDGRRILFTSTRSGRPQLMWRSADGTGDVEVLTSFGEDIGDVRAYSWAPDGDTVAVARQLSAGAVADIGTVSVDEAARLGAPDSDRLKRIRSSDRTERAPASLCIDRD